MFFKKTDVNCKNKKLKNTVVCKELTKKLLELSFIS
jgi:hypothetical protein